MSRSASYIGCGNVGPVISDWSVGATGRARAGHTREVAPRQSRRRLSAAPAAGAWKGREADGLRRRRRLAGELGEQRADLRDRVPIARLLRVLEPAARHQDAHLRVADEPQRARHWPDRLPPACRRGRRSAGAAGPGARRRASGPVGRCARRNAGELKEGGSPWGRELGCAASWATSASACAPARASCSSRPGSSGSTWRRTIEPSTATPTSRGRSSRRHGVHVAELAPGRGHQLLLALLHDHARRGRRRRAPPGPG